MADTYKIVSGNVGKIYELRRVGENNRAVIDFSIATTERIRDEQGNWSDGETLWTNCTAWQRKAENIEKTWKPGDQVMVYGRVKPNTYTNKNEEKVVREVLTVELMGHEESMFPATQDRPARKGEGNSSSSNSNSSSSNSNSSASRSNSASKPAPKTEAAAPKESKSSDDPFEFDFNFEDGSDANSGF